MSKRIGIETEVRATLADIERKSKLLHMSPDQYHDFLTSLMDEINIMVDAANADVKRAQKKEKR